MNGPSDWERAVMQGQQPYQTWGRPKLEIPTGEPVTPRRRGAASSAQSPRGIYEFPRSPQSPGETMMHSPLRGCMQKARNRAAWMQESVDQVSPTTQHSPASNHPGHGFSEFGADCGRNWPYRSSAMGHSFGEYVLVRCNQTKWLVGQVRRVSTSGIKVWIGAAQTLVDVPVELFSTHLARMDCQTLPPSPTETRVETPSPGFNNGGFDGKVRVQCVRPAHLSHRHLYQHVQRDLPNPAHQTHPASLAPNSRMKCANCGHWNPPPVIPGNLCASPEHVSAHFGKERGNFSRFRSKQASSMSGPLNNVSQEEFPAGNTYDQEDILHPQAQHLSWRPHIISDPAPVGIQYDQETPNWHTQHLSWRHHIVSDPGQSGNIYDREATPNSKAQHLSWRNHIVCDSQQGEGTGYHRHSALPMLNLNMISEGTQTSGLPIKDVDKLSAYLRRTSKLAVPHKQPYNDISESPAAVENTPPLGMPIHQKSISPEGKLIKDPGDHKEKSQLAAHSKGKAICEEGSCPKWPEGTLFHQSGGSGRVITQLERSVSLDSSLSKTPTYPGLGGTQLYPGSLPGKPATMSAEPVWVTVIENGHGTRKIKEEIR